MFIVLSCRCQVTFTFAKRYLKLLKCIYSEVDYRNTEQHFGITTVNVAIVFSTPAASLLAFERFITLQKRLYTAKHTEMRTYRLRLLLSSSTRFWNCFRKITAMISCSRKVSSVIDKTALLLASILFKLVGHNWHLEGWSKGNTSRSR